MLRTIRISVLALLFAVLVTAQAQAKVGTPLVEVLKVEGTIVPIVADYIDRGITKAEDEHATVCIIELDTPGGLLAATEKIVTRIMNAEVPVVVYVTPKGAWAASAGTFITLSANIAAMTPGTTIGAAHPVTTGGQTLTPDEMQKVTEFSAKWMKTIAEERGRNIDEAQLAVTQSKSFSDTDALNANLIDFRANTLPELLGLLDGRKVVLANNTTATIDTQNSIPVTDEMNFIEKFLHAISDPNVAYVLLSIGTIGIMAEIYNPGSVFPGTAGAISLLLAFYALGVLNANLGGLLLIGLAFGLFIMELWVPSFGALTAAGLTSLILGSLILFKGGGPLFTISPVLIAVVVIVVAGFLFFIVNRVIKVYRRQPTTGREELVGKTAVVRSELNPEGLVFFRGERWDAESESGKLEPGEEVIITRVANLKLYVKKKE